jgi:hypothetical protein
MDKDGRPMPAKIGVTGLKGEAAPAGPNLVRLEFQLSAEPHKEWSAIFTRLAMELARGQNHGIRPGFRFSYRLRTDLVQVSCPLIAFITPVKGKNVVVQAVVDLVAKANMLVNQAIAELQTPESGAQESSEVAGESK